MNKNVLINWSIEFGPIAIFFIILSALGNTDPGFIFATKIFTILTIVALATAYIREKRVALFPIVAGIFVVAFGLATVYLKMPYCFVLKDTFYNGFFAIVLLVGGIFFKKGLLKYFFASLFDMKDKGWYILSMRWGVVFLILTILNEAVWAMYGLQIWVVYKFWSTVATIIFGSYQITLSRKYRNETATPWGMRKISHHR